jgi:thiol-disulfide isomerase/thioredoxin
MLLEFYGRECPHCIAIRPFLELLEKEELVQIKRYEVWHDQENAKIMEKYAKDRCEGVPFLFNTETKDFVCGEADYKRIKEWALSNKKHGK